jgi:phospholipid transport system substrate-binding protein
MLTLKSLRTFGLSLLLGSAALMAQAQEQAPDVLVKQVSTDVLDTIKADKAIQAGDVKRILSLVDSKILPHVNFVRMTDDALGRYRSQATPEQKKRLQDEYKQLLVRTYAGAFSQVKDQTMEFKPFRAAADATDVTVKSELKGRGDPVKLDYFLEKTPDGWKIYDLDVAGIRLGLTYRSQFAQEIGATGIDGLISKLAERNKASAAKS